MNIKKLKNKIGAVFIVLSMFLLSASNVNALTCYRETDGEIVPAISHKGGSQTCPAGSKETPPSTGGGSTGGSTGGSSSTTTPSTNTSESTSSSGKAYFVKSMLDVSGFGIMTEVVTDNVSDVANALEREGGYNYSNYLYYVNVVKDTAFDDNNGNHLHVNFVGPRSNIMNSSGSTDVETIIKDMYAHITPDSGANMPTNYKERGLIFTFPGLIGHPDSTYTPSSVDSSRAILVSETLTKGLNDALLFIRNNAKSNNADLMTLTKALSALSYTARIEAKGEYTFTAGLGTTFKVKKVTGAGDVLKNGELELIPVSGLKYTDYVKISVNNTDKYAYFPWRMEKGYDIDGPLANVVGSTYTNLVETGADGERLENEYLTWGHLIIQAMKNFDIKGQETQDFAGDTMTLIGQGLGADLSGTIGSVRSMLNLAPMQELVLNMGSRPVTHHYGVMTEDMYSTGKMVYALNLIISLAFLGFLVVKLIHQKMISTTNIVAKTSLMEGLKDIVFVAFMLAFFGPIFELLLEFNYLIVRTFSFSSSYMQAFGVLGNKILAMESMAGFLISTMFLSIDMYINFVYLVRAIVVTFLYAIAPIMIVSYCWGPMQKMLFMGYMREIVGNIFMQSFHAITMTFFSSYNTQNLSTLEALTSAYVFIPITQLFRQLVIGNQGGFSEKIGGQLAGQMASMTMGIQKSGIAYKQSKELTTAQAEAQMLANEGAYKANAINMGMQGFIQGVSNGYGSMTNGNLGSKSGGGGKSSGLGTLGKVAGLGLANVAQAGLTSSIAKSGAEAGQQKLGEINHKHGMENMSFGAMEMGVGLGTSSFNAGAGSAMVGSGLRSIQQGSSQIGEGASRTDMESGAGYFAGKDASNRQLSIATGSFLQGVGAMGGTHLGAYAGAKSRDYHDRDRTKTAEDFMNSNFGFGTNDIINNNTFEDRNSVYCTAKVNNDDFENGKYKDTKMGELYRAWDNATKSGNSPTERANWERLSKEHGIDGFKILDDGNIQIAINKAFHGIERLSNNNGFVIDELMKAQTYSTR